MAIVRESVASSNVAEIGFDDDTATMEVQFRSGGVYHYSPIGREEYEAIRTAESVGRAVNVLKGNPAVVAVRVEQEVA